MWYFWALLAGITTTHRLSMTIIEKSTCTPGDVTSLFNLSTSLDVPLSVCWTWTTWNVGRVKNCHKSKKRVIVVFMHTLVKFNKCQNWGGTLTMRLCSFDPSLIRVNYLSTVCQNFERKSPRYKCEVFFFIEPWIIKTSHWSLLSDFIQRQNVLI